MLRKLPKVVFVSTSSRVRKCSSGILDVTGNRVSTGLKSSIAELDEIMIRIVSNSGLVTARLKALMEKDSQCSLVYILNAFELLRHPARDESGEDRVISSLAWLEQRQCDSKYNRFVM